MAVSNPDVTSAVISIVSAFASGLDIVKKLQRRRRKKSLNSRSTVVGDVSGEEVRLNSSLRRGSRDVQKQYDSNCKVFGNHFAHGDAMAHSSLAQTLLKLNAGLVKIITSFLTRKKDGFDVECKSLTTLSNTSRVETLDALNSLYSRLAASSLDLHTRHACDRRSLPNASSRQSRKPKSIPTARIRSTSRRPGKDGKMSVTRLSIEGSSGTQLAIVRPRSHRTTASESGSSGSTIKPSSTPAAVSSLRDICSKSQCYCGRSCSSHSRSDLFASSLPARAMEIGEARRNPSHHQRPREIPSFYSIVTDSTKLGEIPMEKWTKQFDFEEMEKVNSLSHNMGSLGLAKDSNESGKGVGKKKSLWKRFKGSQEPYNA